MYDDLKILCQNKGDASKIETLEGTIKKLKIENKNLHYTLKEKTDRFKF